MAAGYFFAGIESVAELVEQRLAPLGFVRVQDAGSAQAIITYCPFQSVLENVYLDEGGIMQSAFADTVVIDLSPSTPTFAQELSALCMASNLLFVEAPLCVVDTCAEDPLGDTGNLFCYVSAESAALERASQVLDALVGDTCSTGSAGSAQLARALYSLQQVAQLTAAAEMAALLAGATTAFELVCETPATALSASHDVQSMLLGIASKRYASSYTVQMALAEISAALTTADEAGLVLPHAEAAMHLVELLAMVGGAEKGVPALNLVFQDQAIGQMEGLDWSNAEGAFEHETSGVEDDYSSAMNDALDEGFRYSDFADFDEYDEFQDFEDTSLRDYFEQDSRDPYDDEDEEEEEGFGRDAASAEVLGSTSGYRFVQGHDHGHDHGCGCCH